MNILYVAWTDLGNGNHARAEAINRVCDGSEARCFSLKGYSDYPRKKEGLQEAVNWADVIHQSDTYPWIFGLDDRTNFVCEFRGGFLRMYSATMWKWQWIKKKPVITTPELGRYLPRFHYIPIPIDVNAAIYQPSEIWPENNDPLVVVQSPSRRDYKDTDALIDACHRARVKLKLIEGKPLNEAISGKRDGDICFGKFKVGDFGQSEKEALAMGLAVICRLQPIVRAHNPGCPIVHIRGPEQLVQELEKMKTDPDYLKDLKRASRKWAENFLSYEAIAPRMLAFYEYVLYGDDDSWYSAHSKIWRETAKREHGIDQFVDAQKIRW